MEHRRGVSREQVSLFPESIEDLIPEDHPVRVIDLYIDQLDLAQLGFGKTQVAPKGRPPYHPGDLLKLYLYGYLNRVRSSRRLEAECQRNIEVMWLLGRLAPDHKTIANFRKDEGRGIQAVCREFVQFCRRAGLIAGELVAIDGSKFQAVASRHRAVSDGDMARRQAQLEERIGGYLKELEEADKREGEIIDRSAVQAALKHLREEQETLAQQRTNLKTSRRTVHIEGEAEARLLKDNQGRSIAGYNVQSAVDAQHKFIVHHEVVCQANDLQQLLPMALAVKQVLAQEKLRVVADAGYSSGAHLSGCEANGITAYVALNRSRNPQADGTLFDRTLFHYDAQSDTYRCPANALLVRKQAHHGDRITIYAGISCHSCTLKPQCTTATRRYVSRHFDEASFSRCEQHLAQEPHIMRLRGAIVEHPFGNLKRWVLGNARYLVRGLMKVKTETALAVLAYNLRRSLNLMGVEAIRTLLKA
jgi:transposase